MLTEHAHEWRALQGLFLVGVMANSAVGDEEITSLLLFGIKLAGLLYLTGAASIYKKKQNKWYEE